MPIYSGGIGVVFPNLGEGDHVPFRFVVKCVDVFLSADRVFEGRGDFAVVLHIIEGEVFPFSVLQPLVADLITSDPAEADALLESLKVMIAVVIKYTVRAIPVPAIHSWKRFASAVGGNEVEGQSACKHSPSFGIYNYDVVTVCFRPSGILFNWITNRRASFTASSVGKAFATSGASKTRFVPCS